MTIIASFRAAQIRKTAFTRELDRIGKPKVRRTVTENGPVERAALVHDFAQGTNAAVAGPHVIFGPMTFDSLVETALSDAAEKSRREKGAL